MMLRAVTLGFVDDVSQVLEAFIGKGGSDSPILIVKIVVDDLDGASSGNMLMAASETVSSASPSSLAACRRV
jgi:hypothetical protein